MHAGEMISRDSDLRERLCTLLSRPDAPFPVLCAKLKLTWRCNLRCRMCGVWRGHPEGGELPLDVVERTLHGLAEQGLRKVHFSGGEVLLYKGFEDVLACAQDLGLQVNLTTNGTLLDKEWAKRFLRLRVHRVTISIDAPEGPEHDAIRGVAGSWSRSMRAIRTLVERRRRKGRGPRIAVNTVLTRSCAKHLDKLHALLQSYGVDAWQLLPIDTDDKSERPTAEQWQALAGAWDRWRPLLARPPIDGSTTRSSRRAAKGKFSGLFYTEHRCFAPWFNLFIDADGRVYPCCMGRMEMTPYGNILEHDLSDLLRAPHRREIQQSFAAGHQYAVCDRCDDFLEENRTLQAVVSATSLKGDGT